jgi:Fe-Mn family superoxide dismutase
MKWNDDMRKFLEAEEVDQTATIYVDLEDFKERLNTVYSREASPEELPRIQQEVEQIHNAIQHYVWSRQSTGGSLQDETFISAGNHQLPPLPYPYNALEPYISAEIMRLHHTKHHQSYVDGLNKAENSLVRARRSKDYSLVKHWSRELAFHGSGHYLHTIFWNNMSPNGGGKPSGILLKEIEKYFGSFDAFKKHFTEAAKAVEGVGWAILVWSPRARHLEILQSERHMILTQWDTIPLLVLDVWEHAYYLQYKNNKGEYVDNWWNVVNWKDVEERFEKAKQLKWKAY